LTTRLVEDAEPLRIRVKADGRLHRDSDLLIDQIRSIDNQRLADGPLTRLSPSAMSRVACAILEVLDLQGGTSKF
jgi:mRNA interferase MazF